MYMYNLQVVKIIISKQKSFYLLFFKKLCFLLLKNPHWWYLIWPYYKTLQISPETSTSSPSEMANTRPENLLGKCVPLKHTKQS